MKNLYITMKTGFISDVDYYGYYNMWLSIITIAVILSGIFVIISKNPILSVLYLIFLFLCVSGYLMLIGLNFIGLSYLLVYVGAVSILFLFILMLINIRISEIISFTSNSIPLGIFITSIFLYTISPALPKINTIYNEILTSITGKKVINSYANDIINNNNDIYINNKFIDITCNVYSNSWDNIITQSSYINSIGNVLYTNYPLWLILASLVLLLAMVGCIVITIKH